MKLSDIILEEKKVKEYTVLLAIPFADKNNIKGELKRLEFALKVNKIQIKRISSTTISQQPHFIDVRTALVLSTELKRTEIEDILEPQYRIIKFTEK